MFTDPRERSVAVGVWIGSFSAGSAIGPLLGGLMLEYLWWGSVFLLALPVMALLLILGPRVLPEYRDPDAGRLDPLSAGMSIVALLAVIFGLKEIAQDGVGPMAVAAIVIGLVVGALWVRRQGRLADPMIDVGLFRIRTFNAALAVNFLSHRTRLPPARRSRSMPAVTASASRTRNMRAMAASARQEPASVAGTTTGCMNGH